MQPRTRKNIESNVAETHAGLAALAKKAHLLTTPEKKRILDFIYASLKKLKEEFDETELNEARDVFKLDD